MGDGGPRAHLEGHSFASCPQVLAPQWSSYSPRAPALAFPCRVVDGATLAGFARAWAAYVESPGRLLLHLR